MTTSKAILEILARRSRLAVHEITILGASDTAISARLRELARQGMVTGSTRKNKRFKEWSLKKTDSIYTDAQRR